MLLRLVACALLATGCDRVFGLHDVPDAAQTLVTGHWVSRTARLDAGKVVVDEATFEAARVTLATLRDDGSSAPVDYDAATGNFSFAVAGAGARYRLQFGVDGDLAELQHAATALQLATVLIGRPGRLPVTRSTVLKFLPSASLGGQEELATLGVWTDSVLTTDHMIDWQTSNSLAGATGLIDTTAGDRVFLNQFGPTASADGQQLMGIVGASELETMTLVDGLTQSFPVTIRGTAAAPHACFHLTADRDREVMRVVNAYPTLVGGFVQDWIVHAIPSAQLGFAAASNVAYTVPDPAPAKPVDIQPRFYAPFGEQLVASVGVAVPRTVMRPDALPSAAFYAGTRHFGLVASDGDCAARVDLPGVVGIAGPMTLDDVALDHDGVSVPIDRTRLAVLSWELGGDGAVDRYEVTLQEVVKDSFGRTAMIPLRSFRTVDRLLWLDPALLARDHYYLIRIDSVLGLPGAATGDLATAGFPGAGATGWSMLFRIAS